MRNDSLDSQYLQGQIKRTIRDIKKDPDEKMMVPALKWVGTRLLQSFPDSDVTQDDIYDMLREPGARGVMKKAGTSAYEIIDFIWEN